MQTKFDEQLLKIDIYDKHCSFLPFIGDKYDKYQILHVGESHYIDQTIDNEKYNIEYFQDWWAGGCPEIEECFQGWFTRPVVEKYINKGEGDGKFTIFNNFLKSFCRAVMDKEIIITKDNRELYEYIAFMNFFQMPAIYKAMSFKKSLWISAKNAGDINLAKETWNEACQNAVETLDAVIEVIDPKAVVITSMSAGNVYKQYNGKHQDIIIFTSHPASPLSWNKQLKSLGGKKGIDVCENGLKVIYKQEHN